MQLSAILIQLSFWAAMLYTQFKTKEGIILRILIIEDDIQLNNIISKHLREAGYAVDCCFDGENGLYYMESTEYDCVILDWMLPKRDGLSVLRSYHGHSRCHRSRSRPGRGGRRPPPFPLTNCWPVCAQCCGAGER